MTVPRERLAAVLDAFTSLGHRNVAGAAQAVAAELPAAAASVDPAATLGKALPADWLAANGTTRRNAGAALATVLDRELALAAGASPPQKPEAGPIGAELVVVTALGLEHRAAEAHLTAIRETTSQVGTVYTVGTLGMDGPGVALLQAGQGNASTAVETERALALFAPRAVMFVGVAGGLKDNPLGTVVAADAVYDYSHVAEDPDQDRSRMKTHHASHRAAQAAQASARSGGWLSRRVEPGTGWPDTSTPTAVVKPIAAGPRLVRVRGGATARWINDQANDAAAIEMEGWGFLQAAYAYPNSDALVVRGLSDRLEDKSADQDDRWQPAAAANAAAFAVDVAIRLLRPLRAQLGG